jgi:uncharacterized protein
MRIFLTGATGFVGRALSLRLLGMGYKVAALVRDEAKARNLLGPEVALVPAKAGIGEQISQADAVINLAGQPAFGSRWTAKRKHGIAESRINITRQITSAIANSPSRPAVLISASAVGYYGDRGNDEVVDDAPAGTDFLATLCKDWELAALEAEKAGVRVFTPRLGIVFGADGGALSKMVTPFRFGLGGRIGNGRQYVPWIHMGDLINLIVLGIHDERLRGPLIVAAPNPVTNRELATALGHVLHRPSVVACPAFALRILFGEGANPLLTGQRVRPRRLEELGFVWRFSEVEGALRDILKANNPQIQRFDKAAPKPASNSRYLAGRRPRFVLSQETRVPAPIEEVFHFFSKPENLGPMTPRSMRFRILGKMPEEIRAGLRIEYAIGLGPIPMRWRTCIEEWRAPVLFVDSQEHGPYHCWWHEHHFEADGAYTLMCDHVFYAPPLGPAGTIANFLFVAPALRRIFSYRRQALVQRFPVRTGQQVPSASHLSETRR